MLGQQVLTHAHFDKLKIMFSGRDCLPYLYLLMVSKNIIKKMMKLNDNLLHLKRNKGLRNGMEENPRRCYNAKSKLCLLTCPTG